MQPAPFYSRYAPGTPAYAPSSLAPQYVYPPPYSTYASHPVPYPSYVAHAAQYPSPPPPMHMPPPPMLPAQAMYPAPAAAAYPAPPCIIESSERDAFYRKLHAFRDSIGEPIQRLPTLGFKELDLWVLYKEVVKRRGIDAVIAKKQWKEVAEALQLPSSCTDSGFRLRLHYKKYLEAFERKYYDPPALPVPTGSSAPSLSGGSKAAQSQKDVKQSPPVPTNGRRKADAKKRPTSGPAPPEPASSLVDDRASTPSSSFASYDSALTVGNDIGHESTGSASNDSRDFSSGDGICSKGNGEMRSHSGSGIVKKKKRINFFPFTPKSDSKNDSKLKRKKSSLSTSSRAVFTPVSDHTVNHTVNHTVDHTVDRTADHTVDRTADHTSDRTVDHTADRTADHTADPVVGKAANQTPIRSAHTAAPPVPASTPPASPSPSPKLTPIHTPTAVPAPACDAPKLRAVEAPTLLNRSSPGRERGDEEARTRSKLCLLEAAARAQAGSIRKGGKRRRRVDFSVLDSATLRRYARAHGMGGEGGKEALADCVGKHFSLAPLGGGETDTLLRFIHAVKRR